MARQPYFTARPREVDIVLINVEARDKGKGKSMDDLPLIVQPIHNKCPKLLPK